VLYCLLFVLLSLFQPQNCFSQTEEWDNYEKRDASTFVKDGLAAGGETLLYNGVIFLFNGFVTRTKWAFATPESIKSNLTSPWEWEEIDGFFVNQLGHPYQGQYYFSAGRVNNLNFYESAFFSALGSLTWEVLGESKHAGMNDFVTTVTGSMAMGEILFRLYIEACNAGVPAPLAFFINPAAGFHRLVSGRKPPKTGSNIYQFEAYLGAGYSGVNYTARGIRNELYSFNGFSGNIGTSIIYGDPFDQETKIPYRHFEFAAFFGFNPSNYKEIRVNSDGYLLSFSPVYSAKNRMSTGLTMHLDFVSMGKSGIVDSTIDQYSNAFDWTIKYKHLFTENTALQLKNHTGFTFFGVSNYYSPSGVTHPYSPEKTIYEVKNYGYGINVKNYLIFDIGKTGKIEVSDFHYLMWTYPGLTSLLKGFVYWHFTDIAYSQFITKKISMGVKWLFAGENGTFSGYPDTKKKSNSVRMNISYHI